MSHAGKVPTEITGDLGVQGVQNPPVNLEQACSDLSKSWIQCSPAAHVKVGLDLLLHMLSYS